MARVHHLALVDALAQFGGRAAEQDLAALLHVPMKERRRQLQRQLDAAFGSLPDPKLAERMGLIAASIHAAVGLPQASGLTAVVPLVCRAPCGVPGGRGEPPPPPAFFLYCFLCILPLDSFSANKTNFSMRQLCSI
ncbi:unnamed protein product [Prorocentrum cordatum]|uniref:Uncharacterized protein n=1 Tax=Prorocentrum cordatum TaxID=2364126 RepID=A0ABN9WV68_9DINO|nr:unnamed protein product [Polarella glacialis]